MNVIDRTLFPKATWWLLLLIPLTFFGFYPTYFSLLFNKMESVFHLHAAFMLLWIAMAISQPFLIKWKKTRTHRLIGKISYFIMPVVFVTAYMIIRFSYHRTVNRLSSLVEQGQSTMSPAEIINEAADNMMIGIVYLAWLIIFYFLGVINRKQMVPHSTYMFAAALTLLGPTVDRIIFQVYQVLGYGFNLFAETAVFVLIDIFLLLLFLYQRRRGRNGRPALTALVLYIVGQISYFLLPKTAFWGTFVHLIM
jgi:hypothetical protein